MTHWKLVGTVAAVMTFSALLLSQTPSGHALFEQALAKERVEGNLPEAIRLYERVVTEFASDRALAAQALVQVGLCYEKLGRDEAVRAYERLVRDFADQEDAVELARVRLAALKRPAPGASALAATPTVRALPRVDGINAVLALSPDGTKSAFLSFDKGQNLAVYDVASQQTKVLTNFDWTPSPTNAYVDTAVWSPDGRRIAYMQCPMWRGSACELRASPLAGESSVIFRTEPDGTITPAGWLPDSSALVVVLGRADKTFSIGLVPAAGGPFTPLRSINNWSGGRLPEPPSVSPDGRLIAFADGSQGMRDIHVITRDGRSAHRITDHAADDHQPLWSPDGRHLAFLSNRNGSVALWTVAVRDGQTAGEPDRIKNGMQDVASLLSWTTRGLAYRDRVRTDDVYLVSVNPTNGEPQGTAQMIPYRRTGRNIKPEWSPDGKYLAFVSSSASEPDRLAVVLLPSGGGESREFPFPSAARFYDLRWFGDSRGLGFSGYDARGDPTLFRLTLATGEWKTFPLPAPASNLTQIEWNGDGSRYFYGLQDFTNGPSIIERDLQSDRERLVFRGNANTGSSRYRALRFSSDRRSLAVNEFNSLDADQSRIVVVDIETGHTRVVYANAGGEDLTSDSPAWSPSGRALLMRTRTEKQPTDLRLIPIDGGEVRRIALGAELTRLLSPGRGAPRPTIENIVWSPDGSRLAFVLRASRDETWVLENPLALAGGDASSRK